MKKWDTQSGQIVIQVMNGRSNVFLIKSKNQNILVDTGVSGCRRKLHRRLKTLGVEHLECLVLTHTHYDHTANAAWIRKEFNTKIIVHKSEALYLKNSAMPVPSGTMFYSKFIIKLAGAFMPILPKVQHCEADILADDIYDLQNFGSESVVMHTPGHTEGSQSIIVGREIALVGDTLFGVFRNTVMPPFANDPHRLMVSWERLIETGCRLFIPSHGRVIDRHDVIKSYNKCKVMFQNEIDLLPS
jgi:hydroxyacylglutathione hydrolase